MPPLPHSSPRDGVIHNQVMLPFRVAFGVVMQGIRIRLGRSIVTITGVLLGIAFLMSILTGQALKKGVEVEDRLRAEVVRMRNFLVAETGPPRDRIIGCIVLGALSAKEQRLLDRLHTEGALLRVAVVGDPTIVALPPVLTNIYAPEEVGRDASAIIVAGNGSTAPVPWPSVMMHARQSIFAPTRVAIASQLQAHDAIVQLEQELKAEEKQQIAAAQRRADFRDVWIIVISLLVTVMGISNAMLMSVTERFRDIGTMKCLGALSAFVRRMFLIESSFMGVVGGALGCLVGALFSITIYVFTYGAGLTMVSFVDSFGRLLIYGLVSVAAGIVLSVLAAIYPASVASHMVPADALRSNV
jgi:hypothetical protein